MSTKTDPGVTAYENLKIRFDRIINLEEAQEILSKDAETVMADGSSEDRSKKMPTLHQIAHEFLVSPEVETWLNEAETKADKLSPPDRRNLSLMRRSWIHSAGLPPALASKLAEMTSRGERIHTKNYNGGQEAWDTVMKDWYTEMFDVMREIGTAKQKMLGSATPYEALMDVYMPGVKEADVAREFDKLETELKTMIRAAQNEQDKAPEPIALSGTFPKDQQEELCIHILEKAGYDFNRGVFDLIDGHPSMAGSRDDARISTRFYEDNFLPALFAAVHEGGHANYVQGYPKDWEYQPVGQHLGLHVHESQSMAIEREACKSPEFFEYLEKAARKFFERPDDPALAADNLQRLVNRATPSFIRVDADEMTYPLHVILRFRLGRALINGEMEVNDLPQAWNDGMKDMLGIEPDNPSKGHMQDVHWPLGLQGYFPSYALGAMMASQMFAAAVRDNPAVKDNLKDGDFTLWNDWLRENVHQVGSLKTAEQMLEEATGEPLNANYLLDHLSRHFLGKPYTPYQVGKDSTKDNTKDSNKDSGPDHPAAA